MQGVKILSHLFIERRLMKSESSDHEFTTHRECLSLLLLCTYILARYYYYLERAYVGVNLTRVCLSSCMLCVY